MKKSINGMDDLQKPIENIAPEVVRQEWSEEEIARYHAILMGLLEETQREFDRWPEWKKHYSITTKPL